MKQTLLLSLVLLLVSAESYAEGGLMGSAVLSGAGQGLASSSSQMMSIYGAAALQQQQFENQARRDQQLQQWQAERETRGIAMVNEILTAEQQLFTRHAAWLAQRKESLDLQLAGIQREAETPERAIRIENLTTQIAQHNAQVATFNAQFQAFEQKAIAHGWVRKK